MKHRRIAFAALLAVLAGTASVAQSQSPAAAPAAPAASAPLPTVATHGNVAPAGASSDGVLVLRLVAQRARWHPEAEPGPSLDIEAFGEEDARPSIPGPLIRVRTGTRVETSIRNALPDTLLVFGLSGTEARDTIRIAPGATGSARLLAGAPGTYAYGGATVVGDSIHLLGTGNQLLGALIVDSARPRADRVFVMSIWPPSPGRFVMAINGRSWPHTERLDMSAGDSAHWRIINGTRGRHPMHLHGFYFRVDARGSWGADTALRGERPTVVTESVPVHGTFSMTWTAERPGNWLFHCHDALHTSWRRRFDLMRQRPPPTPPMHDAAHHVEQDMAGLVLGIRVRDRAGTPPLTHGSPQRRVRVVANEGPPVPPSRQPVFRYAVSEAGALAQDSLEHARRPLVLTRGQRAEITVVNRLGIPTAVHWHGIELESYYDGVAGWSGSGTSVPALAPLIMPNDSFVVRMTPPRAGTFIYHAHADDMRQIALGLSGALIVLPPGARWSPARDHVFLFSQLGRGPGTVNGVNGTARPEPVTLAADVRHRFRFINISIQDDMLVEVRSGADTASWRPIAKDGADLPRAQTASRPALLRIAPGETYDFAVVLPVGDHRMSVRSYNDFVVALRVR